MEPLEYLRLIRRRWRLLAACVLVAAVASWVTTPSDPENRAVSYRATTTLLRDGTAAAPVALPTVALFVKAGDVPVRVAERLDLLGSAQSVANRIEVETDTVSGALRLTATATSRETAAELANVFAEETLGYLGSEAQTALSTALNDVAQRINTLEQEVADLEERIDVAEAAAEPTAVLEAQRDSKAGQYAVALDEQQQLHDQPPPSAGYTVLETATADAARVAGDGFDAPRSRPVRVGLAIALGLLLGMGVVLAADRLDPRVFTRDDLERAFGLPVVAEIPFIRRAGTSIITVDEPSSAAAEAYRSLRAALVLTPVSHLGHPPPTEPAATGEPTVILITSPSPGDGKTTTVANLAAGFAEAGRSVLVLGCDFRRPEIHTYFGTDHAPGLSEAMEADGAVDLASVVRTTKVAGVQLAPSGAPLANPGEVAAEGRALVLAARRRADVVLIDTAPILATNDAVELMATADAVVIVARAGRTTSEAAKRTRDLLERMAAPVLGTVLVGAPGSEGSYSGYYYSTEVPSRRARRRRRRELSHAEPER